MLSGSCSVPLVVPVVLVLRSCSPRSRQHKLSWQWNLASGLPLPRRNGAVFILGRHVPQVFFPFPPVIPPFFFSFSFEILHVLVCQQASLHVPLPKGLRKTAASSLVEMRRRLMWTRDRQHRRTNEPRPFPWPALPPPKITPRPAIGQAARIQAASMLRACCIWHWQQPHGWRSFELWHTRGGQCRNASCRRRDGAGLGLRRHRERATLPLVQHCPTLSSRTITPWGRDASPRLCFYSVPSRRHFVSCSCLSVPVSPLDKRMWRCDHLRLTCALT